MFSKILRPLTDLVRHILSKPDERGDMTSDLFRLKIRGRVNQLIKDNNGFLLDIDVDFLIQKIEDISKRDSKAKITFYPNFTNEEIRRYYTEFDLVSSGYGKRCLSPWMVSYIFPDGTVRPCQS